MNRNAESVSEWLTDDFANSFRVREESGLELESQGCCNPGLELAYAFSVLHRDQISLQAMRLTPGLASQSMPERPSAAAIQISGGSQTIGGVECPTCAR